MHIPRTAAAGIIRGSQTSVAKALCPLVVAYAVKLRLPWASELQPTRTKALYPLAIAKTMK